MTVTIPLAVAATFLFVPQLSAQQQPDTRAQYAGQTWVGLLVADSCPAAETASADAQADLSTADRVTTPAVDDAGVRGSSPISPDRDTPAARTRVPFTGDIEASRNDRADPGWRKAKRQASHLGAACRVTSGTQRFALVLPNGQTLRFDQLADEKIRTHLKTPGSPDKPRIFRVQVTGKLQDGAIAVDSFDL